MPITKFLSNFFATQQVVLHFNKPFCQIYFDKRIKAVHLDWRGQATTEQFIEACEFSLHLLVKNKASKMIADNSRVIEVSIENQNWLTENWFPRALEQGFQYSAVIQSDKAVVRSALQLIVSKIDNKHIIVHYFNELSLAKKWLSNIK